MRKRLWLQRQRVLLLLVRLLERLLEPVRLPVPVLELPVRLWEPL